MGIRGRNVECALRIYRGVERGVSSRSEGGKMERSRMNFPVNEEDASNGRTIR